MIRNVCKDDADIIAEIYNYYIDKTVITFEEEKVPGSEILSRIEGVEKLGLPWIVATDGTSILGYAYAAKWRDRSAYRFSVESTVYLDKDAQGRGIGSALYEALLDELRTRDVNVVIGGITLPNEASVALHEKVGMKKVAHFENVGYKFDQWYDVGYWQLSL